MSSDFNIIEKSMSKLLAQFPGAKKTIKRNYQRLNFFIYKNKYQFKTNYAIRSYEYKNHETFFGYYDKSPLNENNEYLLFHATPISTRKVPNPDIPIKIVIFNMKSESVVKTFESHSYNWQQGARTQWIDKKRFIFNDYEDVKKTYVSKIVNINNMAVESIINFPIYDVKDDIALSLNFERLANLRPDYGYKNSEWKAVDLNNLENDGIFTVDLIKNSTNLLISFKNILQVKGRLELENAKHKVNHIMISPRGDKFVFLHRYFVNNRKYDRLLLSDIHGKEICLLADHDMVSHYSWINNDSILSYMRDFTSGDKYYKINVLTAHKEIVGKGVVDIFGDGHPSVLGNMMVFDTYPDKARMLKLFLYNMDTGDLNKLGEFFESLFYSGESRCDLHPRWSKDGKYMFFDSVHSGYRKLYRLEL